MPSTAETETPKPARRRPRKAVVRKDVIKDRGWQTWIFATCTVALIALTIQGAENLRTVRMLEEADAQIAHGFAALAAEALEPIRHSIVSSYAGCKTLIGAYFGARRPDRLEWAAQACISKGIENTDTRIALAAAREQFGLDADALKLYQDAVARFTQSPDPLYRMAQLYKRLKREQETADALLRAAELAPTNAQLSMEALEALSSVQRWSDARRMGDRIKAIATDNPEVKLVIARALRNGGDPTGAHALAVQARELIAQKPELKSALEQVYGELLRDATPPTRTPATHRKPKPKPAPLRHP